MFYGGLKFLVQLDPIILVTGIPDPVFEIFWEFFLFEVIYKIYFGSNMKKVNEILFVIYGSKKVRGLFWLFLTCGL